jgi:hypothetical protein
MSLPIPVPPLQIVGLPLPYSIRMDDGVAILLLGCFFFSAYMLTHSRQLLVTQLKEFLLHRDHATLYHNFTRADVHYLLLLVVQTCLLGAIFLFNYFTDTEPASYTLTPPYLILATYTLVVLCFFFLNWLTYSLIGWIFIDKKTTTIWMESYSTLLYYLGFTLFPFVLLQVYFSLSLIATAIFGLFLVVLFNILTLYKWLKLFCKNLASGLLLILYFCALEIIPLLLLYKGMEQLNQYMTTNF